MAVATMLVHCIRRGAGNELGKKKTNSPADSRWRARAWWGILVVLCGALFLDALDVSMVGLGPGRPSARRPRGLVQRQPAMG